VSSKLAMTRVSPHAPNRPMAMTGERTPQARGKGRRLVARAHVERQRALGGVVQSARIR
jgi:hypothetical protein